MSIISILVFIIVVAVTFWLTSFIDEPYRKWVRIVLAILFLISLLNAWGGFGGIDINHRIR